MAREVKAVFPYEIGDNVRVRSIGRDSMLSVGHVGIITQLIVRASAEGALRYCVITGSREELPILTCELVKRSGS